MSTSPPARTSPLPRAGRPTREQPPGSGANMLVLLAICVVLVAQTIVLWPDTSASSVPGTSSTMQDNIIRQLKSGDESLANAVKKLRELVSQKGSEMERRLSVLDSRLEEVAGRASDLHDTFVGRADGGDKAIQSIRKSVDSIGADVRAIVLQQKTTEKSVKEILGALGEIKDRLSVPIEAKNDQPDFQVDREDTNP